MSDLDHLVLEIVEEEDQERLAVDVTLVTAAPVEAVRSSGATVLVDRPALLRELRAIHEWGATRR